MAIPLSFLDCPAALEASPDNSQCLGDTLADRLATSTTIESLLDCLPCTTEPAILSTDSSRLALTHRELHDFVSTFTIPRPTNLTLTPNLGGRSRSRSRSRSLSLSRNDRVAILLPNGPENAVALLCVSTYHTCAPLNASCTPAELREDIVRLNVKAILTTKDLEGRLGLTELADEVVVVYVEPRRSGPAGLFDLEAVNSGVARERREERPERRPSTRGSVHQPSSKPPNRLDDRALVLCTSGTSGKKKVVPYTLRCLIVGSWAVVQSWGLKPSDVNLNMMPLFHVGGVVRNLLSPILSGGSTIVCPGFDAVAFWSIASALRATWYYAAPTIHNAILASQPGHIIPSQHLSIRMICNAAGGLLPSLALDLKNRFDGAVVLPSYGMTECMPIASPPTTYQLDRPGCSGVACGPHISIRDPLNLERELSTGKHGAVSVRGFPMFSGYEISPNPRIPLDTSVFTSEGWFDTGDVGYLDEDGYLFITGRSKEIINKGGEVISPFEVEEAVSLAAKGIVKATLAFSVEHDVLQEAIGLVIVPTENQPRIGLQQLQSIVKDSLHPSKWPFLLVYANDVPKNSAGKPQRINLAKRMGLPCFSDSLPFLSRHFEASISPLQANISDALPCNPVSVDFSVVHRRLSGIPGVKEAVISPDPNEFPEAYLSVESDSVLDSSSITASLSLCLPGYAIPELHLLHRALPRTTEGGVDFELLEQYLYEQANLSMSPEASVIRDIFADLLNLEPSKINIESDFFLLGGNSLLLGKLAYQLRKSTGVDVAIAALFTSSTVTGIMTLIDAERGSARNSTFQDDSRSESPVVSPTGSTFKLLPNVTKASSFEGFSKRPSTRHQHHPFVLLIQAIPFIFFFPLKFALTWTSFLFSLSALAVPHHDKIFWVRMGALLCSMLVSRLITRVVNPLVAIVFKWIVIGRYEPGVYPMWSNYHLRWWIVNQALNTAGQGIFSWSPSLQRTYYRLLGAKIGRDVKIDKAAQLGELDLITLHDGCRIDKALVRGFCVERDGYFRLAPIVIGSNASINTMTQIAPGATIPGSSVYGPQSSSWEDPSPPEYAAYNRNAIAQVHWSLRLLIAWPIIILVEFASLAPWFVLLWRMLSLLFEVEPTKGAFAPVIVWFANPTRIGYHLAAKSVKAAVVPILRILLGIVVKRVLGLNKECRGTPSQLFLLRQFISSKLLSQRRLRDAFTVLGAHYENVSVVYRAMGAKIGRRVYWPGTGVNCLDPELLEIGDDVVFGSRSELFTTDGYGSEKIIVGKGAMIADRVVLLPGTKVGARAVMGSGTLGTRNAEYLDGSTWMGSKNGKPMCLKPGAPSEKASSEKLGDTITPFGRAFYGGKASFYVLPYPLLVLINVVVVCSTAVYWSTAAVVAAVVLRSIHSSIPGFTVFESNWYQIPAVYGILAVIYIAVINIQAILALTWVTLAKWVLIGRRLVGEYDWDKSSYCQRWKLHLTLFGLVSNGFGGEGILRAISGTAYIVWYYRANGAKIGKGCSIFAGGELGLITEPDLVELGDNVSLDYCSVVAHINSRGRFSLNRLQIGDGCALRSGSRLLSGASMEDRAVLAEHTLLTSGEVAASSAVYVGWPGRMSQKH